MCPAKKKEKEKDKEKPKDPKIMHKKKANRCFNAMVWLMLGEPLSWIQSLVASVNPDDPKGTSPDALMDIDEWEWLVEKTTHLPRALIEMATLTNSAGNSSMRAQPSGALYEWIRVNFLNTAERQAEVAFGPWDTDKDEGYDSGMCLGCHYSNSLINGRCPIYDACDVC